MQDQPTAASRLALETPVPPPAPIAEFCERHYGILAAITLILAAFNLAFRINHELVTTWDESLYATSAAEMVKSGNWLVTTFHGDVDYYNSKPPLNIWLIALAFKVFGVHLWSLRLPSIAAAWTTIAVLQWWCRRTFGAMTALVSTVVLSTMFAFLYVHSARSGNPDAWLTLAVMLTVITLWSARDVPSRLLWLGPLAAMAFLLKGMAVLLPVLIVACVLIVRRPTRADCRALAGAAVLFLIPSGAWAVQRWRFDGWRFFDLMFNYDFVTAVTRPVEGHEHGWWFYLYQLQKDHYDWLAITILLCVVIVLSRREHRLPVISISRDLQLLLVVWAATTMLVPTVMATRLPWYLNPFYPVFAIAVATVVTTAFRLFHLPGQRRERLVIAAMVVLGFLVAEGKLLWYSYHQRDISGSLQGFFLDSRDRLDGQRVLQEEWDPADQFVLTHIANGIAMTGNPREITAAADEHDLLILMPGEGGWMLTKARQADTPDPPPDEPVAPPTRVVAD